MQYNTIQYKTNRCEWKRMNCQEEYLLMNQAENRGIAYQGWGRLIEWWRYYRPKFWFLMLTTSSAAVLFILLVQWFTLFPCRLTNWQIMSQEFFFFYFQSFCNSKHVKTWHPLEEVMQTSTMVMMMMMIVIIIIVIIIKYSAYLQVRGIMGDNFDFSLCSIGKLSFPPFSISSFLLYLPISYFCFPNLEGGFYSFYFYHQSFNGIMKMVTSSQSICYPIDYSS